MLLLDGGVGGIRGIEGFLGFKKARSFAKVLLYSTFFRRIARRTGKWGKVAITLDVVGWRGCIGHRSTITHKASVRRYKVLRSGERGAVHRVS